MSEPGQEIGFWRVAPAVHNHDHPHEHPHQWSDQEVIVELRNENMRLVEAIRASNVVGNMAYRMQQALDSIPDAQVPEVLREFRSEYGRIEGPAC